MSANGTVLPPLKALLDQAPPGVNPYAWWSTLYEAKAYPPQAAWAKPIFILLAIIFMLNIPLTIWTLVLKYRGEGHFRLHTMREHRRGGSYICLNAASVFLLGHIITCTIIGTYFFLHIYVFGAPGRAWMDLSWASLIYLAPYLGVLCTTLGVLYAVLVAPATFVRVKARRSGQTGLSVYHPPLANVSCWLLNTFVFALPVLVIVGIGIPMGFLITTAKQYEGHSASIFETVDAFAKLYTANITPSLPAQVSLLQMIVQSTQLSDLVQMRWRVAFIMWLIFVSVAAVLAVIAFIAVRRVTKTRLELAKNEISVADLGSRMSEVDDPRDWNRPIQYLPQQVAAIRRARMDHRSLSIQFGAAAVLLIVCNVFLFFDVIYGFSIHTTPNLVATAILGPPLGYALQSTASVLIILFRALRGRTDDYQPQDQSKYPHSRSGSDQEIKEDAKKVYLVTPTKSGIGQGMVMVSELARNEGPVSHSMTQQIQVCQTVEIDEDRASLIESQSSRKALV